MLVEKIHSGPNHSWFVFARDPDKPQAVIDTNQYLVRAGEEAILFDPGGIEIFPPMLSALTSTIPVDQIDHIFLSHQDPDIGSSLPLWRSVCRPDVKVHISRLWTSFVAHFDREATFSVIPDEGARLRLGAIDLEFVPAHYLHSSGNFNVYDPAAGILFSGDIGAALMPPDDDSGLWVTDFNAHVPMMEGFHRRWMGSEAAKLDWIERVSRLDVRILAPQHGKMFRGEDVKRFLDWFRRLEVGSAIRRGAA